MLTVKFGDTWDPGAGPFPMMTSSNENIFRVIVFLWGESTSHRWIALTKASDTKLWCFHPLLIKQLSKQSIRRWFETLSHWLWRYCNANEVTGKWRKHYSDVIKGAMASQITEVSIIYSTVCSGAGQRKHQSSASFAFLRGIHRWSVNSPHKGPVTLPFDDVIMAKVYFYISQRLFAIC